MLHDCVCQSWVGKCTKGAYERGGHKLFSKACCDSMRNTGFKLTEGGFRPIISKEIFYDVGSETL